MEFQKFGQCYVVRIDRGEEVVGQLEKFVKENKINLGFVEGIGAADEIKVGLFDPQVQEYYSQVLEGNFEITSLKGNISTKDGEPYLHLHITAADEEFNTHGGHLNRAVISGTCELVVVELDGSVGREFSSEVGLNLFKFGE